MAMRCVQSEMGAFCACEEELVSALFAGSTPMFAVAAFAASLQVVPHAASFWLPAGSLCSEATLRKVSASPLPIRRSRCHWVATASPQRETGEKASGINASPLNSLARPAFIVAFTACLSYAYALSRAVHLLRLGASERRRNEMSVIIAQSCFRWIMLAPCPWIRLRGIQELQYALKSAAEEAQGAPYILANHNSPMDSLLVSALLPAEVGANIRSMIKAALLDEPLFGSLCADCGHFPVYFKRPGGLSVHKDLQAPVTERVDKFIGDGGGLCLFPEGTLNRTGNPRQLQPFRHGGFALPMKHKKAIWGILNAGCYDSWPVGYKIGGYPGVIDVKVVKICDDASTFDSNVELAEYAQATMQGTLDRMYAERDREAGRLIGE